MWSAISSGVDDRAYVTFFKKTLMHYKRLTLPDLPALQQIGRLTYEPYYQHVWHPGGVEWYIDHCFNTERLTEEMNDPHCEYYIASTNEGAWVGLLKFIIGKPVPDATAPDPLYVIEATHIDNTAHIGAASDAPKTPGKMAKNLPLSLEKVYLMPEFYKKGMGQVLIQFALERARQIGSPCVWLNVLKTGPVRAYKKIGFSIVGEQRIPFELIKEEERVMWVMVKNIGNL